VNRDSPRFVYVLRSAKKNRRRHYVGMTSDGHEGLAAHNAGLSPHTSRFRPRESVVAVECPDQQRAVRLENYLKSASGRAFAKRRFA